MNISKSYTIPEAIKLKKIKNEDQRHFVVIPIKAVIDRRVTGENLRALCALAGYCNKSGYSFVSLKTIAKDLKCTPQNIGKHLKKIERLGYIQSFSNYFPNLKGNTRRIIYDDKIKHDDLKNDDLSNNDILTIQRHTMLLNQIESDQVKPDRDSESVNQSDDPILAIFKYLKSEGDMLAIEKALEAGSDPIKILDGLSTGLSVSEAINYIG
jgi:predicted transcriptional regulator